VGAKGQRHLPVGAKGQRHLPVGAKGQRPRRRGGLLGQRAIVSAYIAPRIPLLG